MRRAALISEQAYLLAAPGGIDSGVQNVDVRQVAPQVKRMLPRKGVGHVVQSISVPRKRYGIAARSLVVCSNSDSDGGTKTESPTLRRLARLAAEHGIQSQISFQSSQRRALLQDYVRPADVLVSTPLETLACATPVTGSAAGLQTMLALMSRTVSMALLLGLPLFLLWPSLRNSPAESLTHHLVSAIYQFESDEMPRCEQFARHTDSAHKSGSGPVACEASPNQLMI